ncbi:hypothetical protein ACFFP0_20985 [Rhizobium puerariae]|uniref:Surface antigen n=1 Tax=Rhizobium puerariae TaxID=1585791 RepID=A0ABV6AL37_9HYPH
MKTKRDPIPDEMRSLNLRNAVSLLVVAGVLAGCGTSSRGGTGGPRSLLSPKPAASTSYISELQGGIVGRTGVTLSASDRSRALEAEYRALEEAAVGQTIPWKGDDASGQVVVNAPYQVGTQNCRQYRHTVTAGGREATARGAACRNSDGTWTPLT